MTLTDLASTSTRAVTKMTKDIKTRLEVGEFGKTLGMIRMWNTF